MSPARGVDQGGRCTGSVGPLQRRISCPVGRKENCPLEEVAESLAGCGGCEETDGVECR